MRIFFVKSLLIKKILVMDYKEQFIALGFSPKENTVYIYSKKYSHHGGYAIHVDFEKSIINYGSLIVSDSKTTQNFSQSENFVVLECVDRLLEKGYKPQDIILEKVYPSGHGHSGRLDILINKDGKAFLMIECKTWGSEFEKEFKKIRKDGGQLLTYFQNDTNADYLMLYASRLTSGGVKYCSEIIKIEDNYRTAGNVEDVFARWSKLTYSNGIFEDWVNAYEYQNKLLTKKDLIPLTEDDSGTIFHGFLSILRKHSVSDKPNAFNKIFNLFLAKIYDEKKRETDELDFQWKEREDNPVDFQIRLINLHKEGLLEFLRKEIVGISDEDFDYKSTDELQKKKKERLKFNKIFDIKDVIDDESFDDNFRVLKEVVQLLEKYQIRYPRKQQHLSDFFERLLTTGLKQEAGQYFTPPPITKFVVKSLPLREMVTHAINQSTSELPAVIDYAAGSGHFITEVMEAYQDIINGIDTSDYYPDAQKEVAAWRANPYSWAAKYIYGIEKDYRLVKVAKVGCYFYGDGLAQIIHGDGLDSFIKSKSYAGLLKDNINSEGSSNAKFSIVISNPPYSVDAFKGDLRNIDAGKDFTLYENLTDRSKEIECLFVERTKHLLKEGGIAGIILPSSILSNTGIYTKTREIILQYFDIVAIADLGSNTFMATGTNTVILFLRRRNNKISAKIKMSINGFLTSWEDNTLNGVETPVAKYAGYVWEGVSYDDYISLLRTKPSKTIEEHDIYKEYRKKIKTKTERDFWDTVLSLEKEKMYYFILGYLQKVVLVKSGDKDAEKRFLGYEFSNRRGSEGIHPIQRGKTIDECTKLFYSDNFTNPKKTKASTYIYEAFNGNYNFPIDDSMKDNVFRTDLVDMLTFDRVDFEKTISLAVKKKVKIESKWKLVKTGSVISLEYGKGLPEHHRINGIYPVMGSNGINGYHNEYIVEGPAIIVGRKGSVGKITYVQENCFPIDTTFFVKTNNSTNLKYLYHILLQLNLEKEGGGTGVPGINRNDIYEMFIPLPPKDIQEKIVEEIEDVEIRESSAKESIDKLKNNISSLIHNVSGSHLEKLENISVLIKRGKSAKYGSSDIQIIKSGQARGYLTFDFADKYFVADGFALDDRKLEKGDILINSTGVGTAGRVTLFNLNGNFVVDSHITILRLNSEVADPKYVLYALADGIGFKNIEAMAQGQSGQIELSIPIIQNIKIPLPTIDEQKKIAENIQYLENQIAESQKIIDRSLELKDAILKKYL
ncbi:putative type I restriction enzymeP M protein [Bacteroidales bacterium Barb6]|nr:putative type I restriction enzymeP M protein [Bacteroidales bacterium Barb6]